MSLVRLKTRIARDEKRAYANLSQVNSLSEKTLFWNKMYTSLPFFPRNTKPADQQ